MKLTIVLVREKHADDTIDYKINGLEHIANSQQGWGDVTLIAAPEYHFRNPSSTNVRTHHVNFHTKEHITGRMKEVSRKFPKVIFIPGTVAWKQPANEREANARPWRVVGCTSVTSFDDHGTCSTLVPPPAPARRSELDSETRVTLGDPMKLDSETRAAQSTQ
jgi:hypothetical protein